jgi:periplasmic protein TonB
MAYLDETAGRSTVGMVSVVGIHVFLGFGLLALSPEVRKAAQTIIEAKDVKEEQEKEEEPPPPPEKLEELPPYVPPPDININIPPPPSQSVVVVQQEVPRPTPAPVVVAPPPAPPPAPKEVVRTAYDSAGLSQTYKRKSLPEFPPSVQNQMENENKKSTTASCQVYIAETDRIEDAKCEGTGYEKLDRLSEKWLKGVKVKAAREDGVPKAAWVRAPNIVWRLPE